MGKKSKDKDREHKKKKKHRSSRSRSRETERDREKERKKDRDKGRDKDYDRKDRKRSRSRSRSPRVRVKEELSPPIRQSRKEADLYDPEPISRIERTDGTARVKKEEPVDIDSSARDRGSPDRSYLKHEQFSPEPSKPAPKRVTASEDGQGAGENLSIEETNALRLKLGLKPLDTAPKDANEEKESLKDDIHKPAVNIADVKRTEKLKEKMAVAKDKRKLNQKLGKVKGLADSDSDDDVSKWVKKQKKIDKEKKAAEERAKLLDEMDEEFGISSLMEKEMKSSAPAYTSRDLKGLKVAHDQSKFKEGATTILTLADRGVLDEGDDELMNVNMDDMERTEKNLEKKKLKPTYNPYEMEEDEYGMLKPKDVLSKYDEEIAGPKKGDSFQLGSRGAYNTSQERRMEEIRNELQKGAHTLTMDAPAVQSEFYTQQEMDAKFKKRKKKLRKVKKPETVKADDLLPLDEEDNKLPGEEDTNVPVFSSELATHMQQMVEEASDPGESDYTGPLNLDDEVEDDYHSSLALQRKLKHSQKMEPIQAAEKLLSSMGRAKEENTDVDFLSSTEVEGQVTLTATDEFCRNLGSIPTYGQSGNRNETRDELMDFEQELTSQATENEDEKRGWERVQIEEEKPVDLDNLGLFQDSNVFEEEVLLDGGVANALRHASMKGFVETSAEKQGGVTVKDTSSLLAKNYSIEDKRHDDIDEKFKKRGRGERYQGPLQDFVEKAYIPDFNLTYQDEHGRDLNEKEAFRVLSHKFHGKGSGKKKTEKRLKKLDEGHMMMTMNSTDTPLNTVARLKEKQAREQSAYIVLSGGNKTLTGNSVVK
ncbi:U4/U6.U5 tri-snRNP-associated protein 1-like [Watersipora subatra]|uniref:U4/U6.U5 tri-snRNP-associated protein 1-like n=1 Tax=Watersipora subatra TaxID=2589382 RepID=UPI00355B4CF4